MKALLQAVKDLHDAELYDDLKFFVSLRLEEHLLDEELEENEQALLYKLIADAFYETNSYFQSIKFYERALEIVRRLPRNSCSKIINQAELRFAIHKAYLRERKYDEAIKSLTLIPKSEQTPKSRAALAKLLTARQPNSKSDIVACHNYVLAQFPSTALHTHNELLNLGPIARRNSKDINDISLATKIYFKAKLLVNELKPLQAIEVLREYKQPNAKIILELANLYNFVGNRSKAISELERLRLIDPYGAKGMDLLASLYYASGLTTKTNNQLESLTSYLNECHPNEPETFISLAYLSKQQNQSKDAQLFAQRALALNEPGKSKSNAALLRALLFIENKNYVIADQFLNNILLIDSQCIGAYELKSLSGLQRNLTKEVKATGQACLKHIGNENPRAVFIYAQSIYNDPQMKEEFEKQIKTLVKTSPFLTDAIVLFAKYYDREQHNYSEAVETLRKAAETNLNPIVQTIISDMEGKCKKPESSTIYQGSILNQSDDVDPVLNSLNSTPVTFSSTPDCGIPNSVAYNRGAPRRQRTNAVRQSGTNLMARLDFSDSFEAMRQDLFSNSNGFMDEIDEDIVDVTTNVSFLRRS